MQNCDAEFMLRACYEKLYPGKTLVFDTASFPAHEENASNLFSVLFSASNPGDFFLSRNDLDSFAQYLSFLDKRYPYFLRIGPYGGVDGFQLLRFINDAWELSSSMTHRQILTRADGLTEQGRALFLGGMTWGTIYPNYCLSVKCCTKESLQRLMRYLAAFTTIKGAIQDRERIAFRRAIMAEDSIYGYIFFEDYIRKEIGEELRQLLNQMKVMINRPKYSLRMLQLNDAIDAFLYHQDRPSQKALIDSLDCIRFQTEHGVLKRLIYRLLLLLGVSPQRLNHSYFFKSPILELKDAIQAQLPKRFVV